MKKKIFSILLALVLGLSLGLATAVPATASPGTLNVIPIPMELNFAGGLSEWSIAMSHTGSNSIHLKTTSLTAGAEARAVIRASSVGVDTLADIDSVSWWEYLVQGYPPHVEIYLDIDGDGSPEDWLVIEYAYNTSEGDVRPEGQPNYGAETGAWYRTFSDDGNGPVAIDDGAYAWLNSQAAGPVGGEFGADGHYGTTLADWKAGQTVPEVGEISASTVVTHFVIEVDNWRTPLVQADVYVDDIAFNINGVAYFGSIQYAIDSAQPNDTIIVAAGTYVEDLSIPGTKTNLELVGATGATIKGVQELDWPEHAPAISILASGVKIHGFTIESPDYSRTTGNPHSSGITVGAADVEIYDNTFVATDDGTGNSPGWCTLIETYGTWAGDVSGLNIHDNTFTSTTGTDKGSEGIYINYNPDIPDPVGTVTIANNTFGGQIFRAITTERSKTTISGNTISSSYAPFVEGNPYSAALRGIDISSPGANLNPNQDTVVMTGNTINGFYWGFCLGATNNILTNISATNNTVETNTVGIKVRSSAGGVVVNNNNISGNTLYGVDNADTANTLDATCNWWGHASGPDDDEEVINGRGDKISLNVDAGSWLRTAPWVPTIPTKADILKDSGVPGKGLEKAPGQQKPFNPNSKAGEHAGKKDK